MLYWELARPMEALLCCVVLWGIFRCILPIDAEILDMLSDSNVFFFFIQNFNKELDEACKIQRGISVPDVLLRQGLKRDNAEHLIPQYNAFFEM